MWPVKRPQLDALTTFKSCIDRVRDTELVTRLNAASPTIQAASNEYEAKAEDRRLNEVVPIDHVGGFVTREEMISVYDSRMAAKGSPGRAIYDKLKMLPAGDRCPFCDQRNVSTLDHVLPKADYPALTVAPLNLVGACIECNFAKRKTAPTSRADVILHPYFDNISAARWLAADVIEGTPCAIVYRIERPESWDDLTEARARHQFGMLKLGALYSSEAARELSNIRLNLHDHLKAGGAAFVKAELMRQFVSRRANRLNSWQTAFYDGAAQSEWFCNGGFL
ncbi:MAG: HNH endonuclease [Alphaproteobacteria bacterium]|nr:HNH endonuclease [Alphaproteobacteria bacterium]